jgi:MvdC family ATP-grasp ribosomal peptide maturase
MALRPSRDIVLLLTHTADYFTVDRVAEALERRGATPVRFDTDLFPLEAKLAASLSGDGCDYFVEQGGAAVSAGEVRAVWNRKIWVPRMDESLDPQFYDMCVRESSTMLRYFLDGLRGARWVNRPHDNDEAENKLRQLRVAKDVGLRIPRTLSTNDSERARAFFDECEGRVVAKLLRPLSVSMGQAPIFVYTSDVSEQDLADAEMLRHSPMVFQERVSKSVELRIAYVAGEMFAGAIDARGSARGQTDWRLAGPDECPWFLGEVPDDVARKLKLFMSELRLVYGAIDMIRTPEGEHVFLEVNPGGEWGMLERDLGLPISEALAGALVSE